MKEMEGKKNNNNRVLRKWKAWSVEEDRKLVKYIKVHGDNKWKQLITETGLDRCYGSCRTRWKSYLKPRIIRGDFSEDEEDLIMRLHNLLGNRWCLIAKILPDRTDIEIKKHWYNTLAKKNLTITKLNIKMNQSFQKIGNAYDASTTPSSGSKDILMSYENDANVLDIEKINKLANEDWDSDTYFELLNTVLSN